MIPLSYIGVGVGKNVIVLCLIHICQLMRQPELELT